MAKRKVLSGQKSPQGEAYRSYFEAALTRKRKKETTHGRGGRGQGEQSQVARGPKQDLGLSTFPNLTTEAR